MTAGKQGLFLPSSVLKGHTGLRYPISGGASSRREGTWHVAFCYHVGLTCKHGTGRDTSQTCSVGKVLAQVTG